jgi:hypothetical protein
MHGETSAVVEQTIRVAYRQLLEDGVTFGLVDCHEHSAKDCPTVRAIRKGLRAQAHADRIRIRTICNWDLVVVAARVGFAFSDEVRAKVLACSRVHICVNPDNPTLLSFCKTPYCPFCGDAIPAVEWFSA